MIEKPKDSIWTDEQWSAITSRGTNILVSAGAGSGKTAVLSERVLQLVCEGVDITNLIVLTFTNAAASEMKERIRKKLLKVGEDNPRVLENAQKIDSAFITTFDSYCLYLIKKYNYLLNIDKKVGIIDNVSASEVKKQLMDNVLQQRIENGDKELIDFISTYSATSIDQIISILLKWYDLQKQDITVFNLEQSNGTLNKYEALVLDKLESIKNNINEINTYASETNLPEKIESKCLLLCQSKTYDQIHQAIEIVFETKSLWQIPRTEFTNKEYVKKINQILKDELKELRTLVAIPMDQHMQMLDQNSQIKNVIKSVLDEFSNQYQLYKSQVGLYEYIDINLMAIELLAKNKHLATELKESTYEIMIDEYQDTNDIQEKFISLISNNNVYMVGDIKQSIYGFRNANPKLFSRKYEAYKNNEGGKLITLTNNFRSSQAVLNQVNEYFEKIMDSERGGIDYNQDQKMKYGNKIYDLLPEDNTNQIITYDSTQIEVDKTDFEIMQIFKDIKSKLESNYQVVDGGITRVVKPSDFAIICSTRESFERIIKIGEFYNISVTADVQQKFSTSQEIAVVQSVLNILNVINTKSDENQKFNYSIMQLARSYLFEYTDNQIDVVINSLQKIKCNEISKKLYYLENSGLAQIGQILHSISRNIGLKSNGYLLTQIIAEFKIVENLHRLPNPHVRQLRIARLCELVDSFDEQNYNLSQVCNLLNTIEFNDEFDIDFSSGLEIDTDSVNVTTIHKSKGLEYNICYFPFLFKKFNITDLNNRYAYTNNFKYIFPAKLSSGNLTSTVEKTIYTKLSKEELLSEKIRVLYVALTRAKNYNIMIVDINSYEKDKVKPIFKANSLEQLILNGWNVLSKNQFDSYELSQTEIESSQFNLFSKELKSKEKSLKTLEYKKIDIETNTFEKRKASSNISEIISKSVANNIKLGNSIHEKLEFTNLFEIESEIEKASGIEKKALINIKNSNVLDNMINYYPEFQFKYIDEFELNGIIDLLIEKNDCFIIVDYKLNSIDKPEYVNQVNTYMKYIKQASNKKVDGYLLSLITGELKHVEFED